MNKKGSHFTQLQLGCDSLEEMMITTTEVENQKKNRIKNSPYNELLHARDQHFDLVFVMFVYIYFVVHGISMHFFVSRFFSMFFVQSV